MECPGDGDLQLGVNDPDPAQNLGAFSVQVSDVTVDPTITLDALTPITVDVPADAGEWVPTGITCVPGAAYSIWADGVITWGADQELTAVDAGGTGVFAEQGDDPTANLPGLESAQHSSRVGAIGAIPPYVGLDTYAYLNCHSGGGRTGEIVLGLNDLDRADNSGAFTVILSRITSPAG